MYKNILIALLLCINFQNTFATNYDETFMIYGDSKNIKEAYEVKRQLIKEYQDLVKGLDEKDYSKAISDCLVEENCRYENHTLYVYVGDGKGEVLSGKLKTNYCEIKKDEIETHFFFKKIWQSATS